MVNTKKLIQNIKSKEMDRKDFLKYSGLVVLGLVGLKGIASLITSVNGHPTNNASSVTTAPVGRGFGGGSYGA